MKEFYEKHRDESDIMVTRNTSLLFPAHFHRNIEVLLLKKGEYEITVSGKRYNVGGGSIVIVDNYEIHSYDKKTDGDKQADNCVIIFPSAYIEGFNRQRERRRLTSNVIKDEALCDELMVIAEKYLTRGGAIARSASELFFAVLSDKAAFTDKKTSGEGELVRRILVYIEENFRSDISRQKIARTLGYTEAHVSRVFHSYIGSGISEYINNVRLSYIDSLRASGDKRGQTELISDAGFKSQQTYYRAKRRSAEKEK